MTKRKKPKIEWELLNVHKIYKQKVRECAAKYNMKQFEVVEEALKQYFTQKRVDIGGDKQK